MPDLVYFNGELLPATDARLGIEDRALKFGLGFFETFRTSGGRPHHWALNRARLGRACSKAGLPISGHLLAHDESKLLDVVTRLLDASGRREAVFRYTLTGGAAGGSPAEILALRPLPSEPPESGVTLRVLSLRRDSGEWLPRPKSLNYANALLGAQELERRAGAESDEGLFLSRESDFVVETPRQSIAWVNDGEMCYVDLTLGAVEGTCLAWALHLRVPSRPRRVRLDELAAAEAVMVLNAVRGITPVCALWDERDQVQLGAFNSRAHPIVTSLRRQWSESLALTARA